MFGSSLPPIVCKRTHVLFTLYGFVCAHSSVQHILCCVFFFSLRLESCVQMLPVSLDYPLLIALSVFFNSYVCNNFHATKSKLCFCVLFVYVLCLVCPMLPLSPVSCVPNVAIVSCVLCAQCCHCLRIVYVLCLVCPMLPVSPVSCVPNVASVY
jgi:hypothetical protein